MSTGATGVFHPYALYLLTGPLLFQERSLGAVIEEALRAGVRMVQYRSKNLSPKDALAEASGLRGLTRKYGAVLIVNDSVDLALAIGADGVHLGQEDLPLEIARKILGRTAVIGVSTHGAEEAKTAERGGADYIGLGPIFASSTKVSPQEPLGLEGIRRVRREVSLPIYAIGGITFERISEVMRSGADGVAAISALAGETGREVAKWLSELAREGRR